MKTANEQIQADGENIAMQNKKEKDSHYRARPRMKGQP
jgi:hypothetical protein